MMFKNNEPIKSIICLNVHEIKLINFFTIIQVKLLLNNKFNEKKKQ